MVVSSWVLSLEDCAGLKATIDEVQGRASQDFVRDMKARWAMGRVVLIVMIIRHFRRLHSGPMDWR